MLTAYEPIEVKRLQRECNGRKILILDEIEKRKYYEGFGIGKEKQMFEEELKDVEETYRITIKNTVQAVERILPSFLYYMEEFVTLHKKNEVVREKLDALMEKMGRKPKDENAGEDYE